MPPRGGSPGVSGIAASLLRRHSTTIARRSQREVAPLQLTVARSAT
jgi:hypothetical protein